ncbi:bifunctional helix-turn-helix transcriptional regulator/GNAT family N-acetyltransferase [Scytonema millei]|uniref:GNAT family N-acetyltransferase n=1 Tax=Scytonema millei VB511283 TaxID=1245923 RepID=A0A9X5I4A6_9CYAN|nr:bifunctional helix-turn-helix transcriptional regulator/GNAT family N-acetyltransferase [Scytonema millei]NHC34352.1 GNAT family N-acetyltransferase [Scytonema millei VB511283]
MVAQTEQVRRIETVRRFNRFYTRQIGVLQEGLLSSPFSLAEARILYELAHRDRTTASELTKELGLDAGYLSRILRGFTQQGLIDRQPSETDGRQNSISLTEEGQQAFAQLNERSQHKIGEMLSQMSVANQSRLVEAMQTIEELLGTASNSKTPYLLRSHQPGDMGWIVHRHGVLYAREYGWNEQFEALVARIVAEFIQNYDPKKERCWMAEKDDEIVGSVFLVKKSDTVAKLRLLLVEPKARGLGIGTRLVKECDRFARQAGYEKIELWTNSILSAARRIYEAAGYRLVHQEPHHSFGQDLVGQTWELTL